MKILAIYPESASGISEIYQRIIFEMAKYATELRSMTQGRGTFEMHFERYEQVPGNVAQEIIAKYQSEQKEDN